MFVVWGKKSVRSDGGIVGDWCDVCGGARFFNLTNFRTVSHIYYIPLGQGNFAGTARKCTQCGREEVCDARLYARTLTHIEVAGRSIEDILRITNPQLDEKLRKQHEFRQEMALRAQGVPGFDLGADIKLGGRSGGGEVDSRMLTALNELSALDIRRQEVADYLEQLRKWDYLTASEREVLLHEVNSFTKQDIALNTVVRFLKSLPTPAPDWVVWIGLLALVVILIMGFSMVPFIQSWLWGTLFVIAAFALAITVYSKITDRLVRAWVNKTLIPRSRDSQVDLVLMLSVLAGIDTKTEGLDQKITDMVNNRDTIAGELLQKGQIPSEQSALVMSEEVKSPV